MEKWLRLKTVAERTGISAATWRSWIRKKQCPIPYKRYGKRITIFRESDVEDWIATLPGAASPPEGSKEQ